MQARVDMPFLRRLGAHRPGSWGLACCPAGGALFLPMEGATAPINVRRLSHKRVTFGGSLSAKGLELPCRKPAMH